jgi:hypothetical protein
MGDFDSFLGFDILANPERSFSLDDGRLGISTADGQSAATSTTAAASLVPPSMHESTLALIINLLVDIAATTKRLESSGTWLEKNLEHHVADLSERLAAGLKLNRDETDEQIAGLQKQLLEIRSQQQSQQVDSMEKLAACSSSSAALHSCAELNKETVHEVWGASVDGAPFLSRPFASSAASYGVRFVPRKLFIKGFCNFGCEADEGISETVAKAVANSLLSHLKTEYRMFLADENGGISATRLRNSQITLLLRDDVHDDAAFLILKDLKLLLAGTHMHINKKPIFLHLDSEPWKKRRRAGLATASQFVADEFSNGGPGVDIIKDWTSGTLWANRQDVAYKLGHWDRNRGWMWHEKAVKLLIPDADLCALELSMNSGLLASTLDSPMLFGTGKSGRGCRSLPVAVHPVRKPRLCDDQCENNMGALSHDVLCGVSWNVDRIAGNSKEMFVKLMMKQYAFVLFQERGCLLPGPLGSHLCIGVDNDLDRAPGILLHRALVCRSVGTFSDSHVAGVRLSLAGVVIWFWSQFICRTRERTGLPLRPL